MFCRSVILLAAFGATTAGCKEPSSKLAPTSPEIRVSDGTSVVAELRASRPCRTTIGPQELIVGGPPLVATLGSTRWEGQPAENGTILTRDGERVARIYPVGDSASGSVFDLQGIAKVRVEVTGTTATVKNGAGMPIRRLVLTDSTITLDDPALTVTGTDDLILAAFLTAPELLPEIRMIAACERVLVEKDAVRK